MGFSKCLPTFDSVLSYKVLKSSNVPFRSSMKCSKTPRFIRLSCQRLLLKSEYPYESSGINSKPDRILKRLEIDSKFHERRGFVQHLLLLHYNFVCEDAPSYSKLFTFLYLYFQIKSFDLNNYFSLHVLFKCSCFSLKILLHHTKALQNFSLLLPNAILQFVPIMKITIPPKTTNWYIPPSK